MPVELKQQCEQVLSHMQLAAACGDAEGAARQAQKLIDLARSMRDKFLPDGHPRCDQCAEPLNTHEAHAGEHCRKCSLLMSMGAQMASFRARAEAAQRSPVKAEEPALVKREEHPQPKRQEAPPAKRGEAPPAKREKAPPVKRAEQPPVMSAEPATEPTPPRAAVTPSKSRKQTVQKAQPHREPVQQLLLDTAMAR